MVQQDLREPLLGGGESEMEDAPVSPDMVPEEDGACPEDNANDDDDNDDETTTFSIQHEIVEMMQLGWPLAVSFFCRMGMASTDSAFVGHISDGHYDGETYLAAAVLSDMCVSVFVTPPLAFNQVLNALVGQAMGSGNPRMAGIWLQQSVFWLTVTMLPCLVALWFVEPVLRALDFDADVAAVAGTYAKYNALWPIPNGIYQCMRFYFQAQGLPRPAMYNNLMFLGINALLNWFFVMGGPFRYATGAFHWEGLGFIGAAISLSISRTMQSVVYFLYMFVYKQHHLRTWPEITAETPSWWAHHTTARTMEFLKQALPNIGTLLFQVLSSQATTVLLGRLGELPIAASSALSTVSIPWAGSLSATCTTISGVRVGHHLGRGDAQAAKSSTWLVLYFITAVNIVVAVVFLPLRHSVMNIATNSVSVKDLAATLIPAMLVGTYLNTMVGNISSGVFSGMGRPLLATILSFGLELPLTLGGVAVYILFMHGKKLLAVYWWQAISGGVELVIVMILLGWSDWQKCADDAQRRQETSGDSNDEAQESTTPEETVPESSDLSTPLLEDNEV